MSEQLVDHSKYDEDHGEMGEDVDDEHEVQAGHARHTCTDPICLLAFLAALAFLGFIMNYAHTCVEVDPVGGGCLERRAVPARLYHGFDFMGNLCGISKGYENKGTLFWCSKVDINGVANPGLVIAANFTAVDLAHPICIEKCPSAAMLANHSCYQGKDVKTLLPDAGGSIRQEVTYNMRFVQDYETTSLGGRYCLPSSPALRKQVIDSMRANPYTRWTMNAAEVLSCWQPLLLAAILAFILGYLYIYVLKIAAGCLVYTCMAILCVAPLGIGGYLIYVAAGGQGVDGMEGTGDSTYNYICGGSCIVVSVLFSVICCCLHGSIDVAIGCVEAACDCMFSMPSLLLEPLFNLISKILWMSFMLTGLFYLLSCGSVQHTELANYVPAPASMNVGGVTRSFSYTEDEMYYILYYLFMIFWVLEICTALGQFCLAYAVQLWYFCPYGEDGHKHDIPTFPLCRGYKIGLQWHLGSLVFGAFLVAVLRIVRLILGQLARQAEKDGNAAMACCMKCLMCCVDCFKRFIEFLNKNAYMDIAITSNHFCTAAKNAFFLIVKEFPAIAVLNGACFIFQLAGVGAITSLGCYLVWLSVTTFDMFTNKELDTYVQDPIIVTVVAGIICALIAYGFMIVFDTVADTVLYCFATEKKRREKGEYNRDVQYAPHSLNELIADHGGHDGDHE